MFSKAAGGHNGVARKANLVFVRWPVGLFLVPRFRYDHQVSAALFIDGLARILKDVNDNNLQGKAVINMSFGFALGTVMDPQIKTMAEVMRRLEANGVVLVAAAGNYALEVLPGTGTLRTETDIVSDLMVFCLSKRRNGDTRYGSKRSLCDLFKMTFFTVSCLIEGGRANSSTVPCAHGQRRS